VASVARVLEPTKEAGSLLTLTPTAADAVRALVAGAPVDDDTGGIRISSGEETPQGTPLELALVNAPEPADEEIDASVESGGQVRFSVLEPGERSSPAATEIRPRSRARGHCSGSHAPRRGAGRLEVVAREA
jgi:hypothetical protein